MAKTFYELEKQVEQQELIISALKFNIKLLTRDFINLEKKLENKQKNEIPKPSFVGVIINRILSFIPFLLVALVGSFILFSKWMINFVRYGGESIAYTEKTTRKTIYDVFVKLEEKQNNER